MNDVAGEIDHDAPDSPESQLIGGLIQGNKGKVAEANRNYLCFFGCSTVPDYPRQVRYDGNQKPE